MTALSILAIAMSLGAIALCVALCVRVDSVHADNSRRIVKYIETLEQRIKTLEEEVKKGENNG